MTEGAYWHIHHDQLLEWLLEPIENRIEYIRANKPAHEIETRLRLMKPVRGNLPPAVTEAWRAYVEAWRAYDEAGLAYVEAWRASDEALRAYSEAWLEHYEEIEALHRLECPGCPWNGETIFPTTGQ